MAKKYYYFILNVREGICAQHEITILNTYAEVTYPQEHKLLASSWLFHIGTFITRLVVFSMKINQFQTHTSSEICPSYFEHLMPHQFCYFFTHYELFTVAISQGH